MNARFLATLVCLLLATNARADGLGRVKAAGVLRWGGDVQGGEPYVFVDPHDANKLVGYEVELAEAIGRELGVRVEFHQNTFTTLAPALDRGDFDVILNGWEDTQTRRASESLSRPYYRYGERLTVRRGEPAFTLADLRGHRIGTLASTYAHELLLKVGAEVVLYEGTEEPYIDLGAGRIDGVLIDDVIADRYTRGHADLVPLGDVAVGGYVLAARKDEPELAAAITTALDHIEASGELDRILRKWCLSNARQIASCNARSSSDLTTDVAPVGGVATGPLGGEGTLFVKGAVMTALVSVLAMALAVPFGFLLALARVYGSRPIAFLSHAYVELWRGTPVLLQLYLIYFGLSSVIHLSALPAAILGLGLNYAAYEAEVYRGAIGAIAAGQSEASAALGLSTWQTIRHVVMPQAARHALPAVTNDFVALLKDSSLVSVITVVELTKQMTITAVDVRSWVWPGVACAAMYFAMSWPLSRAAAWLERRLA